jgi:hypothetical protein
MILSKNTILISHSVNLEYSASYRFIREVSFFRPIFAYQLKKCDCDVYALFLLHCTDRLAPRNAIFKWLSVSECRANESEHVAY